MIFSFLQKYIVFWVFEVSERKIPYDLEGIANGPSVKSKLKTLEIEVLESS